MLDNPGGRSQEAPFGVRLKAARKMAGLSMEDLAERLGGMVTKQAIGKYEKGLMMPAPEVMERLIQVLQIATWGAAPLKHTENGKLDLCLIQDVKPLIDLDRLERPLFRRQGLLRRLTKKLEPEDDAGQYCACVSIVENKALTNSQPERPKPEDPAHVGRTERFIAAGDFSSLSERRARYTAAWESEAGINEIRFREGERLPVKTASALKYRIADHLHKYSELESILGSAAAFENPAAGLSVRTSDEVETAAFEVRRRWELGSGPVVNLLGLLEDKGIKVYEARGIEDFDGLSGRFGMAPFIAVSMDRPADRVRFTAAHELGHVMCGFSSNESPESMCHAFGAAFLLPKSALEKAFALSRRKVTLAELGEVKEAFGVSLQAIMYRAHGLGFVTDRQLRSFRETLKSRGWLTEEPVAYTGKERAARFRRLLHYAVAADILDVARAAEMAGVAADELKKEIGDIF